MSNHSSALPSEVATTSFTTFFCADGARPAESACADSAILGPLCSVTPAAARGPADSCARHLLRRYLRPEDFCQHRRGAHLAAVDVGTVQPCRVVPGLLELGGLEPDQRAEFRRMVDREVEHDAAADRAAYHDGPVELQGLAERADRLRVARGGELVFVAVPTRRR